MVNELPRGSLSAEFWKDKNVLITGHTGFKGTWLGFVLKELGANLYGFSLAPNTFPSMFTELNVNDIYEESEFADIRDFEILDRFISDTKPDVLIHMAAQPIVSEGYKNPIYTYQTNVIGTVNFLEACRKLDAAAVLVISSDKCYANDEQGIPFEENSPLGGHDPYSSSKGATEIVVHSWAQSYFNETTVLLSSARAGNVVGGGDWSVNRLLVDAARAFSQGKDITVRNPDAIRPWQHVLEPISAYLQIIQQMSSDQALCGPWNVGPYPAKAYTVKEVINLAKNSWGNGVSWSSPKIENKMHEASTLLLDCEKLVSQVGWTPTLSLETTIDWTMKWYKNYYSEGSESALEMTTNQIRNFLTT